jgi:16S rRNA processing protein RimM
MPDRERDKRICIARIGAAHGVRGDVKLWSFTADPAAVAGYGPLQTEDGRCLEIETLRPAKDFFVARFKGISDRNAAERLRHVELFVDRARLPATAAPDEFYQADLVGLALVDRAGGALGTVIAVHNFGAGDLIEVRLNARHNTVMLPFNETVVPEIDIAAGRLVVELPDGTFDDDLPPADGERRHARPPSFQGKD